MSKETNVRCDVESCQHNQCNCCDLEDLNISCTCDGWDCQTEKETICSSFQKKKNKFLLIHY